MIKTCLGKLHSLCYFMIADYKYIKLYGPFCEWGVPQGYSEPLWGDSLLFTGNSWYSLNQSRKDERLRWPWSHPVVLNLFINLVITKHKLKLQYFKLIQLWPLTVNCFKVSSQSYLAGLSKICFLCTYVDQMIIQ